MDFVLNEPVRVGISACNYGAMVRWNRRGWDRTAGLGREAGHFVWTPVCPEVNAGLGVRRMPVSLAGGNGDDFWDGRARMNMRGTGDVTGAMRDGALVSLDILQRAGVEAFAFMEGSPSCGVYRTTLKNRRLGKPPGVFGSLLLKEDLFLFPALDLMSPVKWWDWRRRLHAFAWLKRQDLTGKKQVYDIWYRFKFVCQEVDDPAARRIGRELAGMTGRFDKEFAETWRSGVLRLLRKPSTLPRITAMMKKHYAHYNKHFHPGEEKRVPPHAEMSKHRFVAELHEMEKRAFVEGAPFAATPVLFREKR